ncbi:MAG: hypothetical protein Q9216_003995 [Gyalolechia sp. 2 TL-2023]
MAQDTPAKPFRFNGASFLKDVENTCKAIDAPFSLSTTEAVVAAYSQNFREGALFWRTTDRPGDGLNFCFYERRPVEVLRIAEDAKLLEPNHPLSVLMDAWAMPWGKEGSMVPEQSCDFDAEKGLVKSLVCMGGLRPLDDILSRGNVPPSVSQRRDSFHKLGLDRLRHVAIDFELGAVNLYFRVKRPISELLAREMVELAGYHSLTSSDLADMPNFLPPQSFTFVVTIGVGSGEIQRVAFYALGLLPHDLPEVGNRLRTCLSEASSHDAKEYVAVAWVFGACKNKYTMAEKSYCGGIIPLIRKWKLNGFHR